MSNTVISVEDLSKQYRLGNVGTGTLSHDLNRWWHIVRGKEDPFLKIGEENNRAKRGISDYVWALKDINFEVKKGEVLGIIGKNGAGKSTLLKILSRTTTPTTGSFKVKGRIASLLEVGTGFHPELTGRENIFLNGAILGMTKTEIKNKFDEIVDFSGVERYIDTPVKRYSSGMYVRLAFAVAAHLESEILILDEVLAVGDAEFQKKCLGKMKDVSQNDGRTVLFVSHNMASIQHLCTKILILEHGGIRFDGNVEEGITKYLMTNREKSNMPIADRIDRTGGGILKVTSLKLEDDKGNSIHTVCTGMNLNLRIFFNKTRPIENFITRLQFVDINGKIVSTLSNFHTGETFVIYHGDSICCSIPNFPLIDGEYSINIRLLENNEIIDDLETACYLKVEEGDFYGSGKITAIKHGVLLKHSWH